MNKSVKSVADYIKRYRMTAYMVTCGNQSTLCGCKPFYRAPYSSIESVKCSYSYVKRVFDSL